jgi:transcriptional regulator with XRE-family HTH domain
VIREARRRSGLTQAQLARRLSTTQSAIARMEGGGTEPSLERVAEVVRACGLELEIGLQAPDDSDWSVAAQNLLLSVDQRVRQHQSAVRFAIAAREAMRRAGG